MALTTCEDCGGKVSTAAVTCPHCGRPMAATAPSPATAEPEPEAPSAPEPRPRRGLGFGTLLVIAAVGVFVAVKSGDIMRGLKSGDDGHAAPAPAVVEAPIEVTAERLQDAYQANELHADGTYKGKRLLVTGMVNNVQRGLTGPQVNLFPLIPVAFADSKASALAELRPGQHVKLLCTCGGGVLGVPQLEHCTIAATEDLGARGR